MTGAGAARADYVLRRAKRAQDVRCLKPYVRDVAVECNEAAKNGTVIVEGSQATLLSLYLSDRYPYTTSDNCTTAAFIDDVGLNWRYVERVLLLVKCLPTSVGLGPLPYEMTKEEIAAKHLEEFGINTGRPRRRSRRIDWRLLDYAVMLNGPTEIALTFCDQYDPRIAGRTSVRDISPRMARLISIVERRTKVRVRYSDTGKDFSHIIEL